MKLLSTSERLKELRSSKKYKEWRAEVLERDKHTCVICGSKNRLEVDHIKPLALFPRLATSINNGRTLCKDCHKKTDTYGTFSKFKGESPIHPILAGDLLFKLQSLPQMINPCGKEIGFRLSYEPKQKAWTAGYRLGRMKLIVKGNSIEEVVDLIFDKLRESTFYQNDMFLVDNNFLKDVSN